VNFGRPNCSFFGAAYQGLWGIKGYCDLANKVFSGFLGLWAYSGLFKMLKIAEMVTGDAQLKIVEKNKDITVEHFLKVL